MHERLHSGSVYRVGADSFAGPAGDEPTNCEPSKGDTLSKVGLILLVLLLAFLTFAIGYQIKDPKVVEVTKEIKTLIVEPYYQTIEVEKLVKVFVPYELIKEVERVKNVYYPYYVPYEIPGDVDRFSGSQLIAGLEWLKATHEYAITMFKSGRWEEGSDGLGDVKVQETIIAYYDKMIVTTKWMVNELSRR